MSPTYFQVGGDWRHPKCVLSLPSHHQIFSSYQVVVISRATPKLEGKVLTVLLLYPCGVFLYYEVCPVNGHSLENIQPLMLGVRAWGRGGEGRIVTCFSQEVVRVCFLRIDGCPQEWPRSIVFTVTRDPLCHHFLLLYKMTSLPPETLINSVSLSPPFSCSLLAQHTRADGAPNSFFMHMWCVHMHACGCAFGKKQEVMATLLSLCAFLL